MKLICVPLTLNAMSLLDLDNCPESLLESVTLTNEEHQTLLRSGALNAINSTIGTMIDDYEDENIKSIEDLRKAIKVLEDHLTLENSKTIKKLIHLSTIAIKKQTGLFFFF
jgi:hypothetical protein